MEQQALWTLREMVADRGFIVNDVDTDCLQSSDHAESDTEVDEKEVDEKNDPIRFCLRAYRPYQPDIILGFFVNEKLTIQGIKDRITVLSREGATHAIIVYRSSVTASAKKSIETLDYGFELFSLDELQLNITHHRLVPRHHRVTPQEQSELDKKYKGKLPQILQTDAVCRYYAFKKGEYIRITRKDGSIIYRVVK